MKKILVIDDVAENRDIFTSVLEKKYEVFEASDGRQGLALAEAEQPDLIFLDLSMPGMGGLEMISHLRKHATLYPVPVIAVTAHSTFSAKKAVQSGCNDYLLKPLYSNKIMEKIEQWID